jgi:hypothetical protein
LVRSGHQFAARSRAATTHNRRRCYSAVAAFLETGKGNAAAMEGRPVPPAAKVVAQIPYLGATTRWNRASAGLLLLKAAAAGTKRRRRLIPPGPAGGGASPTPPSPAALFVLARFGCPMLSGNGPAFPVVGVLPATVDDVAPIAVASAPLCCQHPPMAGNNRAAAAGPSYRKKSRAREVPGDGGVPVVHPHPRWDRFVSRHKVQSGWTRLCSCPRAKLTLL